MAAEVIQWALKDDAESVINTFPLPLHKLDGTSAPGVSDDEVDGYVGGSIWIDRTNDKAYVCVDNATGAAVWEEFGSGGGGGGGGGSAFSTIAVTGQDSIVADDPADSLTVAGAGTVTVTTDATTDTLTITGTNANAFATIAVTGQDSVNADSAGDSVTFAGAGGITITTDAGTDTVTFTGSGGAGDLSLAFAFAARHG